MSEADLLDLTPAEQRGIAAIVQRVTDLELLRVEQVSSPTYSIDDSVGRAIAMYVLYSLRMPENALVAPHELGRARNDRVSILSQKDPEIVVVHVSAAYAVAEQNIVRALQGVDAPIDIHARVSMLHSILRVGRPDTATIDVTASRPRTLPAALETAATGVQRQG